MARLSDLRALLRQLDGGADAARMAALADRIATTDGPISATEARLLAQVRARAGQNLRHLGARLAGLRDAQALIVGLSRGAGTRTYGPAGEVQRLDAGPGQLLVRR